LPGSGRIQILEDAETQHDVEDAVGEREAPNVGDMDRHPRVVPVADPALPDHATGQVAPDVVETHPADGGDHDAGPATHVEHPPARCAGEYRLDDLAAPAEEISDVSGGRVGRRVPGRFGVEVADDVCGAWLVAASCAVAPS
jgi:hypothetical protein